MESFQLSSVEWRSWTSVGGGTLVLSFIAWFPRPPPPPPRCCHLQYFCNPPIQNGTCHCVFVSSYDQRPKKKTTPNLNLLWKCKLVLFVVTLSECGWAHCTSFCVELWVHEWRQPAFVECLFHYRVLGYCVLWFVFTAHCLWVFVTTNTRQTAIHALISRSGFSVHIVVRLT